MNSSNKELMIKFINGDDSLSTSDIINLTHNKILSYGYVVAIMSSPVGDVGKNSIHNIQIRKPLSQNIVDYYSNEKGVYETINHSIENAFVKLIKKESMIFNLV